MRLTRGVASHGPRTAARLPPDRGFRRGSKAASVLAFASSSRSVPVRADLAAALRSSPLEEWQRIVQNRASAG
jgi:hypothetical protein